MNLVFKKVQLTNFGSYAKAELDLNDRGFCLVSGENHYHKDNAISNGSGKSNIWSAICYALTGESINGLTNNFKNINIDEDECNVSVLFSVDKDEYLVTRFNRPKSDLKIIKNDIDISGKGIRESEKILADNLPDLTKNLIASTIIIGQGMPNKFSSFSPSGRKDLLERLTNSDYMISDVKARVAARMETIQNIIRTYDDSLLVNTACLNTANTNLKLAENELTAMDDPQFDTKIVSAEVIRDSLIADLQMLETDEVTLNTSLDEFNNQLLQLTTEKATKYAELNTNYNQKLSGYNQDKYQLEFDIRTISAEITRLKSIKDVCPTCGQKLPNVIKPDTTEQEAALASKQKLLQDLLEQIKNADIKYREYAAEIDGLYASKLANVQLNITTTKQQITKLKTDATAKTAELNKVKESLTTLIYERDNFSRKQSSLIKQIDELQAEAANLTNTIGVTTAAKDEANLHLDVLKKMDTATKREFRGYLLFDIIKYIDAVAKDYCFTVFGTRDLEIALNGNALDITYCGKLFDSLSGGEKQRCDLILQFAIRELLQQYLGYSSNILVLDEIFDGLDKLSTSKVIDLITSKLKDVESIFIISHHAEELDLPVDAEIKVIKNENGISEVF